MRNLASAIALAMLCACAGYTSGTTTPGGTSTGGNTLDGGGDGGNPDGGDAGIDGGPDAGCALLSLNGVAAIDGCAANPAASATADLSVAAADAGNACAVSITLSTSTAVCSGFASHGSLDAFDGGCTGTGVLTCTSPSLPGTLTCTGGCTIRICDAGVCSP